MPMIECADISTEWLSTTNNKGEHILFYFSFYIYTIRKFVHTTTLGSILLTIITTKSLIFLQNIILMAALHLSSLTHQSWSQATPITSSLDPVVSRCLVVGTRSPRRIELGSTSFNRLCNGVAESRVIREKVIVKCGVQEANVTENLVGKVTEVNKDTFWPIVHAAQDKAVVLDMYTQWCGPCKMMAPKYEKLAQEKLDVIFLKLDCNQENKSLAKELGIRVVPTFKILKDSKIVKEVTGAKMDDLIVAIEAARISS